MCYIDVCPIFQPVLEIKNTNKTINKYIYKFVGKLLGEHFGQIFPYLYLIFLIKNPSGTMYIVFRFLL